MPSPVKDDMTEAFDEFSRELDQARSTLPAGSSLITQVDTMLDTFSTTDPSTLDINEATRLTTSFYNLLDKTDQEASK